MSRGIQKQAVGVITGASTGIGKALALDMARRYQAKLVLNARGQEALEQVANQVRELGGQAATVAGDVSDKAVIANIVAAAKDMGEVDVLVNNAGFAKPGPFEELKPDDWRAVFEVNFFAPVELTYALLRDLTRHRGAKLVNIASVAGKIAFPGSVCYASTKFALTGFSEGMAAEFGPRGLDVITVCPGLVRTEFFRKNRNSQDVTTLAEQKDLTGWVVRNLISISSEQASKEILAACERGGSQEIVLTGLGKALERISGICPPVAHRLSRLIPSKR